MFKVIIAGGRDFNNYEVLRRECNYLLSHKVPDIEVVCGDARGADSLGNKWALEYGYKVKHFPADWNAFGKSAGYRRNAEMASYADALIAFWDGKSRGTMHMINLAKDQGLNIRVLNYEGGAMCDCT